MNILQSRQHKPRKAQHGPDMTNKSPTNEPWTPLSLFHVSFWSLRQAFPRKRVPLDRAIKNAQLGSAWTEGISIKFGVFPVCWKNEVKIQSLFSKARWKLNFIDFFLGLSLDWIGFWFCSTLNFIEAQCHAGATRFELYSDGLGMLRDHVAMYDDVWL